MRWELASLLPILLVSIACSFGGCGGDRGATDAPGIEDSWEAWEEFVGVANGQVLDEVRGLAPPGGVESWNRHWLELFRHLEEAQSNPEDYVNYVVDRRRALGLPEIRGWKAPSSKVGGENGP